MPSLSSLLLKIPDEFKPWAAIGIGAVILVVLVLFHGLGLHRILVRFKRSELRLQMGRPHLGRAGFLFGWAVFLMLSLHIAAIMIWAFALIALGLILRPGDAIYFCANAYTTLGYGTVDLGPQWRNISPIIAISGLFTFAWTASALVSIVANYLKLVEQLEVERMEQQEMRAKAIEDQRDVVVKEREAECSARQEAAQRAGTLRFLQRRKIWSAERQKEKQLRASEKIAIDNIRRQERLDEDKLGQTKTPGDAEVKK